MHFCLRYFRRSKSVYLYSSTIVNVNVHVDVDVHKDVLPKLFNINVGLLISPPQLADVLYVPRFASCTMFLK